VSFFCLGLTTEFPNRGIPWSFGDFHSEHLQRKGLIPKDSERFGMATSEFQNSMKWHGIPSERCKLDGISVKFVSGIDRNRFPSEKCKFDGVSRFFIIIGNR